MDNHVHLLATGAEQGAVSRSIQSLGRQYVAFFNRKHRRTGTLWEGRFKSALVQTQGYLLDCQRYIELNPVRAGMVVRPIDYPWSSHRFHAAGVRDDIVTTHPAFMALGDTPHARQVAYRALFEAPVDPRCLALIRDATAHGWGIGDGEFVAWAGRQAGRRASRGGVGGRPRKPESDPGFDQGQGTARSCVPG